MSAQRVLITGAGGFVCRNITHALLEAGNLVVAADRAFDEDLKSRWTTQWGSRITLFEGDILTLPAFEVDALIHGAAITASPEEIGQTPEENFRDNMNPVLTMLEWAQRQQVRRAVFISSGAVYRTTEPGPVDEAVPASPYGIYAVAKHATETLIETLRGDYGRDVICIRLSSIYGADEIARATRPRTSLVSRLIADALKTGKVRINAGDAARDWTFALDVGRAVERLLAAATLSHALYHVASGEVITPLEMAQAIQQHLPELHITADSAPSESHPRRGYLRSDRLAADTGFNQWTPFNQGIKQVIDHQRTLEVSS